MCIRDRYMGKEPMSSTSKGFSPAKSRARHGSDVTTTTMMQGSTMLTGSPSIRATKTMRASLMNGSGVRFMTEARDSSHDSMSATSSSVLFGKRSIHQLGNMTMAEKFSESVEGIFSEIQRFKDEHRDDHKELEREIGDMNEEFYTKRRTFADKLPESLMISQKDIDYVKKVSNETRNTKKKLKKTTLSVALYKIKQHTTYTYIQLSLIHI
eukprot:TRINITY_DN7929_c0_g1_i2.p1 TRINITY_DN7929_c0_g1~~TRINITY_DN7929_c0_g1_i2.p1  ORF type:complete len:230 (+),score=64.21 TRINITY_DN7929_c0_g1_i2:60-692(+)